MVNHMVKNRNGADQIQPISSRDPSDVGMYNITGSESEKRPLKKIKQEHEGHPTPGINPKHQYPVTETCTMVPLLVDIGPAIRAGKFSNMLLPQPTVAAVSRTAGHPLRTVLPRSVRDGKIQLADVSTTGLGLDRRKRRFNERRVRDSRNDLISTMQLGIKKALKQQHRLLAEQQLATLQLNNRRQTKKPPTSVAQTSTLSPEQYPAVSMNQELMAAWQSTMDNLAELPPTELPATERVVPTADGLLVKMEQPTSEPSTAEDPATESQLSQVTLLSAQQSSSKHPAFHHPMTSPPSSILEPQLTLQQSLVLPTNEQLMASCQPSSGCPSNRHSATALSILSSGRHPTNAKQSSSALPSNHRSATALLQSYSNLSSSQHQINTKQSSSAQPSNHPSSTAQEPATFSLNNHLLTALQSSLEYPSNQQVALARQASSAVPPYRPRTKARQSSPELALNQLSSAPDLATSHSIQLAQNSSLGLPTAAVNHIGISGTRQPPLVTTARKRQNPRPNNNNLGLPISLVRRMALAGISITKTKNCPKNDRKPKQTPKTRAAKPSNSGSSVLELSDNLIRRKTRAGIISAKGPTKHQLVTLMKQKLRSWREAKRNSSTCRKQAAVATVNATKLRQDLRCRLKALLKAEKGNPQVPSAEGSDPEVILAEPTLHDATTSTLCIPKICIKSEVMDDPDEDFQNLNPIDEELPSRESQLPVIAEPEAEGSWTFDPGDIVMTVKTEPVSDDDSVSVVSIHETLDDSVVSSCCLKSEVLESSTSQYYSMSDPGDENIPSLYYESCCSVNVLPSPLAGMHESLEASAGIASGADLKSKMTEACKSVFAEHPIFHDAGVCDEPSTGGNGEVPSTPNSQVLLEADCSQFDSENIPASADNDFRTISSFQEPRSPNALSVLVSSEGVGRRGSGCNSSTEPDKSNIPVESSDSKIVENSSKNSILKNATVRQGRSISKKGSDGNSKINPISSGYKNMAKIDSGSRFSDKSNKCNSESKSWDFEKSCTSNIKSKLRNPKKMDTKISGNNEESCTSNSKFKLRMSRTSENSWTFNTKPKMRDSIKMTKKSPEDGVDSCTSNTKSKLRDSKKLAKRVSGSSEESCTSNNKSKTRDSKKMATMDHGHSSSEAPEKSCKSKSKSKLMNPKNEGKLMGVSGSSSSEKVCKSKSKSKPVGSKNVDPTISGSSSSEESCKSKSKPIGSKNVDIAGSGSSSSEESCKSKSKPIASKNVENTSSGSSSSEDSCKSKSKPIASKNVENTGCGSGSSEDSCMSKLVVSNMAMTGSGTNFSEESCKSKSQIVPDDAGKVVRRVSPRTTSCKNYSEELDKSKTTSGSSAFGKSRSKKIKSNVRESSKMSRKSGPLDESANEILTDSPGRIRVIDWTSKRNYCCFCRKELRFPMDQHLQRLHWDQEEVAKFVAEGDKKKRTMLSRVLRNRGNHFHNEEVLARGEGDLIVRFICPSAQSASCYKPCPSCLEYYVESKLWAHVCTRPITRTLGRATVIEELASCSSPKQILCKLFAHMKNDDVAKAMKNDPTVRKFGIMILREHETNKLTKHNAHMRHKLRLVGRLLLTTRVKARISNLTLAEAIAPENIRAVFKAVKALARYDARTRMYVIPALANTLHAILAKLFAMQKTESMHEIKKLQETASSCDSFIKRLDKL